MKQNKYMKFIQGSITFLIILGGLLFMLGGCKKELEITDNFPFKVETLPYYTTVNPTETLEFRLRIIEPEGSTIDTKYYLRYFPTTGGKCELKDDQGRVFSPNDLYELPLKTFRLYAKPDALSESVNLEVTIINHKGNEVKMNYSFSINQPIKKKL